jgi:Domain of unknown function (DUF2383)
MAEGYSIVKTVVQVHNNGEKRFADIGEKLKNPELKAFFIKESAHRAACGGLALAAGDTKDIGGTAAGAVHRVWGAIKASLGGSDTRYLRPQNRARELLTRPKSEE